MSSPRLPHDHGNDINDILNLIPESKYFQDASAVFQQLGDSSRLKIFWLLCHSEECDSNIASAVGMSAAAVSHHLKSLRLHGLVISRRKGKEIYYKISDNELSALAHKAVDDFFQLTCPVKGLSDHNQDDSPF